MGRPDKAREAEDPSRASAVGMSWALVPACEIAAGERVHMHGYELVIESVTVLGTGMIKWTGRPYDLHYVWHSLLIWTWRAACSA